MCRWGESRPKKQEKKEEEEEEEEEYMVQLDRLLSLGQLVAKRTGYAERARATHKRLGRVRVQVLGEGTARGDRPIWLQGWNRVLRRARNAHIPILRQGVRQYVATRALRPISRLAELIMGAIRRTASSHAPQKRPRRLLRREMLLAL